MSTDRSDPSVAALLEFHQATDPETLIERISADLLQRGQATVPVDLEVLASVRNAEILTVVQDQSETIVWEANRFVIRLRRDDVVGRRRFSCAHAIIHTYFMEAAGRRRNEGALANRWSPREEELCDFGAASLLLPRTVFGALCPATPTMDDVLALATTFEASAEATAIRVVSISPTPIAMVVLEPALKPAELKLLAKRRAQPSFPGMEAGP